MVGGIRERLNGPAKTAAMNGSGIGLQNVLNVAGIIGAEKLEKRCHIMISKYMTAKQVSVLAGKTKGQILSEPHKYPGATRDKKSRLRFEKQKIAEAFFNNTLGKTNRCYPVAVVESFESESTTPESEPAKDLDIDI